MCKKLFLVFLLMASQVFANVLVKDVEWNNGKTTSTLIVKYEGRMADVPNWEVFGKTFIMTIPSAQIGASITKKVGDGQFIKVAQKSANEVKLTLGLDQQVIQKKDQMALNILDGRIEISIPISPLKTVAKNQLRNTPSVAVPTMTQLDESYLDKLVNESIQDKDKEKQDDEKIVKQEIKTIAAVHKRMDVPEKSSSNYSLGGIAFKMIVFLGVVLGLFYGIVTVFKKGVMSKGKLGFLNNTDLVQVLNTTHLGNKKSLVLVKVHQQAFLISNTEKDLQLISEVTNLPGLIKEGEKQVAGDNFDTKIIEMENVNLDSVVTLKENILESKDLPKDESTVVKFSEQIKNKVKGLRPLQQ